MANNFEKRARKLLATHERYTDVNTPPKTVRLEWRCKARGESVSLKRNHSYKVVGGNLFEREHGKEFWKPVAPSDLDSSIKKFITSLPTERPADLATVDTLWDSVNAELEESIASLPSDDEHQRHNREFQQAVIAKYASLLLDGKEVPGDENVIQEAHYFFAGKTSDITIENDSRDEAPEVLKEVAHHHYEFQFNRWRLVHDTEREKSVGKRHAEAAQEDIAWVLDNGILQSDIEGIRLDEEARIDPKDSEAKQTEALHDVNREMATDDFKEREEVYEKKRTEGDEVTKQYADLSEVYVPLLFQKAKQWIPEIPYSLVRATRLDDLDNKTDFLVIDQDTGDVVARIDANVRDPKEHGKPVAEQVCSGPKERAIDIVNETGNANFSNKGKDSYHLVGGIARERRDEQDSPSYVFSTYENLCVPALAIAIDQKSLLDNIVNMNRSGESMDMQEKDTFLQITYQLRSGAVRSLKRMKELTRVHGTRHGSSPEKEELFMERLERFEDHMARSVNASIQKIDEEKEKKQLGTHERSFQRYKLPEEKRVKR